MQTKQMTKVPNEEMSRFWLVNKQKVCLVIIFISFLKHISLKDLFLHTSILTTLSIYNLLLGRD